MEPTMPRQYWLIKSEPEVYSIDDLKRDKSTHWDGVRNYQARNFMRDEMRVGDEVLFYHSNATPPGVAGIARVARCGYPDHTALDRRDAHYDPKASEDTPIWYMVDIAFVARFPRLVTLEELRDEPRLKGMLVTRRGQRLSVQPVEAAHFKVVKELAK